MQPTKKLSKTGSEEVKKAETNKESKRHYEFLQIHVSRPSQIHKWQEVRCNTGLPETRSYSCSCIYMGKFFIYGGTDYKEGQRDSIYSIELDKSSAEWIKHKFEGNIPEKISHAASVIVDSKWYIIGGSIKNEQTKNILELDLKTMQGRIITPNKSQEIPSPLLDSHTAVLTDNGKALIFGGYAGAEKSNKLFLYKTAENIWEEIKTAGKILPMQRSNHSAIFYPGNMTMYVFGGLNAEGEKLEDLWKFNLKDLTWTEIKISTDIWPRARSGHVAGIHKDMMYIFGGALGHLQEVNDLLKFDLKTEKWDIVHAAEKMMSEEERQSPITALKMKKMREEAKKKTIERSSPKTKGYDILKVSPMLKTSNSVPQLKDVPLTDRSTKGSKFEKTTKITAKSKGKKLISSEDYECPIELMMKNSVVMKAQFTDKKSGNAYNGASKLLGKFPCGRDGHTSQIFNDNLYIFGGDRCQIAYNDLFVYPLSQ